MPPPSAPRQARWPLWLCLGFVTLLAYFTYVSGYERPAGFFWDENYHVASAQKYLNRVYFMEQHPPLGKLLIALGEALLRPNSRTDQFIGTDYARNPPPDFSFRGYRLVPVLLAWLTAPLVFLIFTRLVGHPLFATLLSLLYVFDNALLVHMRGAMLEGPLLFFVASTILLFLLLPDWRDRPRRLAAGALAFGLSLGLASTVKLTALVLFLLLPALLGTLGWGPRGLRSLGLALAGCLVAYVAVWQVHFALGSRIVPALKNDGFYLASDAYKGILAEGRIGSLAAFPVMIRDSWRYVPYYQRGVPRLNLCKPDENGSPFYLWPLGARAINYRWETPDGREYRYLYLQPNPAAWVAGLLGVVLAGGLVARWALSRGRRPLDRGLELAIFQGLYLAYMLAVSRIDRVMYLYHYFIPLLLSFFLFGLALAELRGLAGIELTQFRKGVLLHLVAALVLVAHHAYRPLSYYEPLTDAQFEQRVLFRYWDLRCVRCVALGSFWCRKQPGGGFVPLSSPRRAFARRAQAAPPLRGAEPVARPEAALGAERQGRERRITEDAQAEPAAGPAERLRGDLLEGSE